MEFVIVTYHQNVNSCEKGLKDMTILSIPDALLVYSGCENKDKFAESIVHIAFSFDCIPQLTEHKYCSVNGTLVFRHSTSFRTAIFSLVSEKILLHSGEMYCINKINNIAWQDDDGLCEVLGILEAKIRLGIVKHSEVCRNDMRYYAVPISAVDISECIKNALRFLRCEIGTNVTYKNNDSMKTHRSILFPISLINTEKIPHEGIYSILTTKPNLTCVFSSSNNSTTFGVAPLEKRVCFKTFIAQYHTAREFDRIEKEIMPVMLAMQAGDIISPTIEFATPRGLINYDVTIRNIGRSCMAVTFCEKND